jgi:ribose 1,5-bisphosphokinase PhnN
MPREKSPTPTTVRKRAPRKSAAADETKEPVASFVDFEQRSALIAEAAFFRAEKRGFAPGNEVEDWLAAESEVDAKLMSAESGPRV